MSAAKKTRKATAAKKTGKATAAKKTGKATAAKKTGKATAAKRDASKGPKSGAATGRDADATFQRLRALCLALPDTKLTMTWGSPHFRVGDKIFCGFGSDDGKQILGVKLEPLHARTVVQQARFWPAPYVGKHGWVSMDITQRKSWAEVATFIRESYELIAPKASLAKLP